MLFYLLAFMCLLSLAIGYLSSIEDREPPKSILLFPSVVYVQGDFYSREAADKLCENEMCDHALALVNFMYDDMKRMPRVYSFDRFRPIWYNDVFISSTWEGFLHTTKIPATQPFWTGHGKNCNEWSGSGKGGVGLHGFDFAEVECDSSYQVLCMCY
jgi:hypothetical protein